MRIGQLAETTGVSVDTLRYYERIGLMPRAHRTPSGYRDYPDGARNRIRVIRNAVQLGFPLKEIATLLKVRDDGGAPCRQVRDYARGLVSQLDLRISELRAERKAMLAMIRDWDVKLEQTGGAGRAHLLETAVVPGRTAGSRAANLRRNR
ncbi:MAG: heavy metal-responsive transcriptional regulator [Acidobacteria bacterium]|nr:heavy metal-responsive transcriptional regulator [Acidobacteriota bacterium]